MITPRYYGKGLRLSLASVLVGLGVALAPTAADAKSQKPYTESHSGPIKMWTCTDLSVTYCQTPTSLTDIANGVAVTMQCYFDDAQSTTGDYASPRWFYVKVAARSGWMHSSFVERQKKNVKRCDGKSTHRPLAAANIAAEHIGNAFATERDHKVLAAAGQDWAASEAPYGSWAGYCLKFAALVRAAVGKRIKERYYKAYDMYVDNQRKIRQGPPPAGALEFYDGVIIDGVEYGHVAVGIGNGLVVGTYGYPGESGKAIGVTQWDQRQLHPIGWLKLQ